MSDFFETPEPVDPPEPVYRVPPWLGPPRGTIPGVAGVELVLARTGDVAVYIAQIAAYPIGFELELMVISAPGGADRLDPMLFGELAPRSRTDGRLTERLRFGVQFSDGRKATNVGARFHDVEEPGGPVLASGSGGGSDAHWHQRSWIWPLPPAGPLAFVCEWPAARIALTRHEIDADLVLDAARRAEVVFAEQGDDRPGSSWTTFG